jgi:adenosine deaminase
MITPFDACVEDYVGREGLHETHLHLNGSTHAEICWLRALRDPMAEVRDFDKKWRSTKTPHATKLRELANSVNPNLKPSELLRQLHVAAQLRKWLSATANGALNNESVLPTSYELLERGHAPSPPDIISDRFSSQLDQADELSLLLMVIERLKAEPSLIVARMLHLYVVLQNQYYRLLVQSEEQFGFDQFQKITYTDLREPAERDYYQRFMSIHGDAPESSRVLYLEGRFAPKDTAEKNYSLMQSMLFGYLRYLNRDKSNSWPLSLSALLQKLDEKIEAESNVRIRTHQLALVAHFIKLPWSNSPEYKAGPYRFYSLRTDIEKRAGLILQALRAFPRLQRWVRGIDAAANELHAPPEVFASVYRVCKTAGITRRSYHAGEDFTHLLSGLRHMVDAIELLNLENGDRLGHGTAMGISPKLWVDRMPGQLVVKKGDWLLDLLITWQILRQIPEETGEAYRVEGIISDLAGEIFGSEISCTSLGRAMKFRGLNLRYLMASRSSTWRCDSASFSDLWSAEAKLVANARNTNSADLKLLTRWLEDKALWARSEALIEVESAFFENNTFLRIQQAVMRLVRDRGVVIETLPSSNVRISQYHNFTEHHALRWMRVPGYLQDGDPEIMVSLGSDDPGIFAGDLNSEFYQLYAALRSLGLGDMTALKYLAPLNERGRQYRFHAMDSVLKG